MSEDRAASRRLAWLGAIGAALVALLILANVMLIQIADDQGVGPKATSGGGGSKQALLPPPSQGTSNRATTAEIDRLTRRLDRRLEALQTQLAGGLGSLPASVESLASQGRALVPLAGLAGQAGSDLRRVADSTVSLGSVRPAIDTTNSQLAAVARTLRNTEQSIRGVNGRTGDVSRFVAQTNKSIAGLRQDFQTLNREFLVYFQAFCSSQEPKKPKGCP